MFPAMYALADRQAFSLLDGTTLVLTKADQLTTVTTQADPYEIETIQLAGPVATNDTTIEL